MKHKTVAAEPQGFAPRLQKFIFGRDLAAISSSTLFQKIRPLSVFGVKCYHRYAVRYRWTGPGLTSILAGERQGTKGLSNITAKESISILLLFQNKDRVRMFVQIVFIVLRSKVGHDLLILRFLDHTQRGTTLSRTPLDE